MLLKGKKVNGHGLAAKTWKMLPDQYKLMFHEFYPGTLNVELDSIIPAKLYQELFQDRHKGIQVIWPFELFKEGNAWGHVKYWNKTTFWPIKANGIKGYYVNSSPGNNGRPPEILEILAVDYINGEEVEIEWL